MSRSKWKGPINYIENIKLDGKKPNLIISKRNSKITPKLVNQTFNVYNGKNYSLVSINEEMIGHNLGEFVFTRKKFSFKKKKQKNSMAQRVHPNIFRIGITKPWDNKYIEKKLVEQPNYDFKNLEFKKFIFKFFKDNNFDIYECKTSYSNSGSLHIFLSYYALPINKTNNDDLSKVDNPQVKTQMHKNYFTYNVVTYIKKLVETDSFLAKTTDFKKELQKRYLRFINLEKNFTFIDPSTNANKMKLNFFLTNFIESLTVFIGKKLNIFITFQELNRSLKKNLTIKTIQFIKRSVTKLNKYKDNDFFKEGLTTLYICSKYSNSANLLSEFLVRHLKKTKNPKFFLTFIKKGLTVLKKETKFKSNEIKIKIKGRITKSPRARKSIIKIANKLPVLSIKANINYAEKVVYTPNGTIGVKVWIYSKT